VKSFALRSVIAQTLILIAYASSAGADDLGRLFFDSDQRRNLDQNRLNVAAEPARVPAAKVSPDKDKNQAAIASVPIPPQRITGRVTRSSGNNTVWVNQTPSYVRYSSRRLSKE
jgi:hypothetical protein